jgi:ElaB/YqjD/DUF883 family membrane-anchored ribosome-binding protein
METSLQGTHSAANLNPVNGLVSEAAVSAHKAVDKAAAAAGSAVKSVSSAISESAASGHHAVSKMEDTVKPAEKWIHDKSNALLAAPKNALSDARQYVVTHPWQSVGVALFAGMLLGRRAR